MNVPCDAGVTMLYVSGSSSTSVPPSAIGSGVSSFVVTLCGVATGASFTEVTSIAIVAGALSNSPSFAVNVNESGPW